MAESKIDKLKITIKMPKIFGYIYVTTNLIDGKYYIGQHKSDDLNDSYFGSGLRKSVGKDGYYKNKKTGIKFKRLNEGSHWAWDLFQK